MERGWFPRAVPPAGGLRAARCPGLTSDTTQNKPPREVLEREVTHRARSHFDRDLRTKLRFLLRQDRTVLYPPLVRSFLLRTKRIHRRDAEGAEKCKCNIATDEHG